MDPDNRSLKLLLNRPLIAGIAVALLFALGIVDRLTVYEFDVFLFYAVPVAIMAWWVGRLPAVLLAAGAVAVWFVADDILGVNPYSTVFYTAWNTALRAGWIMIVALTISALRDAHRSLKQRVQERTAELSAAVATLEAQTERLHTLTGDLALAEERERHRLSLVLHDGLQQLLVAARLRIQFLRHAAPTGVPDGCTEALALLDDALKTSHSLSAELSPPILHGTKFVPALEWLARWMADTHQLTVTIQATPGILVEADAARILLFQAVRELLFNVVKHAGVPEATLAVVRTEAHLQIVVADRGVGFDPACKQPGRSGGLGLPSIRQRLEYLGGTLEIASAPGHGSRVTLTVPLRAVS
jgi:signal transduction histidine kinase